MTIVTPVRLQSLAVSTKKNMRHHRNGHRHTFRNKNIHTPSNVSQHATAQNTPCQQTQERLVTSAPTTSELPVTVHTPNSHTQSLCTSRMFITPTTSNSTIDNHNVTIDGSRIINIKKLEKYVNELTVHASKCGGTISLVGEKRYGLASILSSQCECGYEIILESSNKVKGPLGHSRWECNLAAVWGQMTTGSGHSPFARNNECPWRPCYKQSMFSKNREWHWEMAEYKAAGSYVGSWERRKGISRRKKWLPSGHTNNYSNSRWWVV